MATKQKTAPAAPAGPDGLAKLRRQYGCGPVEFTGTDDALYERHLLFDDVVSPAAAGPRERFEAVARSVRDVLSPALGADRGDLRAREPQARLLPVDGVPPRPLAGQQRHEPPARFRRRAGRQGQAPRLARPARTGARRGPGQRRPRTPGGVLPRLDGDACSCRPWATGCATSTASSASRSATAGSRNSRTTGCGARTRGRSPGPTNASRSS